MAAAPAWAAWLEASGAAVALRERAWLYPAVEVAHILGFVVLVGAAAMFDLRLLGRSRASSVRALAQHLLPWARGAVLLVALSGTLLFLAQATQYATSRVFALKLTLIAAAGLNVAAFHAGVFRSVETWDRDVRTPARARLAGALSLALWTGVIAVGRLLAYV
jgi:hypothetical protein